MDGDRRPLSRAERLAHQDLGQIFKRLSALAREKTPFFADIWQRREREFGAPWISELAESVTRLFGTDEATWENMLYGYADFSMEAVRCQNDFEKTLRYRDASSADLLSSCYEDEEFMMTTYLPGLYLSHYLWRHHYRLLSFYRNEVLTGAGAPGNFYEIGIGTGLYSYETLRAFPAARGKGIDISKYSLGFTERLLRANGLFTRYECEQMDIFKSTLKPESADFLVCQEVLEHLEDPAGLCRLLRTFVRPGAKAYITAAINAAHTDHIYLFRSPVEVEKMLVAAGWKILASRSELAYEGKPLEITPCVAGFLCQKN